MNSCCQGTDTGIGLRYQVGGSRYPPASSELCGKLSIKEGPCSKGEGIFLDSTVFFFMFLFFTQTKLHTKYVTGLEVIKVLS